MKTANKTVYIAFDDTEFDTERECRDARLERGGHKRRPKAGAGEPTAASLEEATNDPAQDAADEDKHAAA